MSEPVRVAAALILREGRFLICRRPMHKARGGLWEFPGGKLEPGESAEQALIRECREELAIEVTPGPVYMRLTHEYPDLTVELILLQVDEFAGTPRLLEHSELRWIGAGETEGYAFCPADREILEKLGREGLPAPVGPAAVAAVQKNGKPS
ncbi:MAG: (deoxy)nucleoside triphosphate pyrophosphohydrolase [Firmicutes bacterium]|nr:(deoxy)nucleoside triphosphate pyrophosphohydrolase [Bacillota bacterium]